MVPARAEMIEARGAIISGEGEVLRGLDDRGRLIFQTSSDPVIIPTKVTTSLHITAHRWVNTDR